jgi:hypothetical protein
LSLSEDNTTTSSSSNNKSFSFGSHQSFPLRYGWIEKVCIDLMKNMDKNKPKYIHRDNLKPEYLCLEYGLGSNMAKSIRFWLKACGITIDKPNSKIEPKFTNFAYQTFGPNGTDQYLEKKETIWKLHYNLVTNSEFSSTWSWFFNEFRKQSFDRQQLVNDVFEASNSEKKTYTEANIKRDVDCFVRSYAGSASMSSNVAEDALECPFVELNLIRKSFGNTLVAKRSDQKSLPDNLFLLSIINLSKILHSNTITVETLLNAPYSPGCIFLLNREYLIERLEEIHKISENSFVLDQSSGLAQIIVNKENFKNIDQSIDINFDNKDAA